ncbi:MAG: hypothetical protein PVJ07_08065 [Anaerolineales bacterium]|jgi:P-type E1-E2 ATPase
MIELNIPGLGLIQIKHLVCDVNGTLALDGRLQQGVSKALLGLSDRLELHLLTADTFGRQDEIDQHLGLKAVRLPAGNELEAKAAYVDALNHDQVAAIGQGANDAGMLKKASIGICVLSPEGTAVEAITAADLVAPDILTALAMLQNPRRLIAGLRR